MTVYGLQGEREMRIQLNPTCRSDKYLDLVRETLSGAVLDSPGGYPIFLRRWTRMGQIDHDQIERLLMLGELEAVMAVVCSPRLTDELARLAWWCAPYSEYARRMLSNRTVATGMMGPILAKHLVEHLPFEADHHDMLETVRLLLQPGLINNEQRERLWKSGRTKTTYRAGFLDILPDALPEQESANPAHESCTSLLQELAVDGNRAAQLLDKLMSAQGQSFLSVATDVLTRPADQEVVGTTLNAIGRYFSAARQVAEPIRELDLLFATADAATSETEGEIAVLVNALPQLQREVWAMVALAHISESLVLSIFATSDAVGSVMRGKIEPVIAPVLQQLSILRGMNGKSFLHSARQSRRLRRGA